MLDWLRFIPNYSTYNFGMLYAIKSTRLKLNIKRVDVTGLNYQNLFDSLISISKISIHNTDLYTFRDKRIPFLNTKIIPMPMTSLGAMAFGLEIDSIAIDDAVITIEEFAPT